MEMGDESIPVDPNNHFISVFCRQISFPGFTLDGDHLTLHLDHIVGESAAIFTMPLDNMSGYILDYSLHEIRRQAGRCEIDGPHLGPYFTDFFGLLLAEATLY